MKWVWASVFLAGALLGWTWTFHVDLGFQLNAARFFWEHGDVPRGGAALDGFANPAIHFPFQLSRDFLSSEKDTHKKDN